MTERQTLIRCARVYLAQSRHFTGRHRGWSFRLLEWTGQCRRRARGTERAHHDAQRSTAWAVVSAAEYHRPGVVLVENAPALDLAIHGPRPGRPRSRPAVTVLDPYEQTDASARHTDPTSQER